MKKILGIIVLGLLLSGNAYSSSLIGKQLECKSSSKYIYGSIYYIFLNGKQFQDFYIHKETLKVIKSINDYDEYPKSIDIFISTSDLKLYSIDRKTLKTSKGNQCKVVGFNIPAKLENISKELLKKQTKDNKI